MRLMINELMNYFIKKLLDRKLSLEIKDISLELSRRALKSTADYVEAHMYSLFSVDNKWSVHDLAFESSKLNGAILEFGVFKGETINYLANKTDEIIYGFDSFEGLPEFWRDGFGKGKFAIEKMPQVKNNVKLVKGWFDETIPGFLVNNSFDCVKYLHIDCDLYSSTKCIFDCLGDKIVPGTVIVFDEYFNFPGWHNDEYKAFQEFISDRKLKYDYLTYNSLGEQVAVIIKSL